MELITTKKRRLLVEDLRNIGILERNNPLLWIRNPCLQVNPSSLILYSDEQASNTTIDYILVNSLVITLWKDTQLGFNPELEFPLLRKCFENVWYLKVKNVTHKLTSVLVKKDNIPFSNPHQPVNVQTFAEGPRFFTYDRVDRGIQVTKCFFCEQVRIPYNDGIHLSSEELYILSKNKTLSKDKYTENKNRYENETTFSVCLEDLDIECSSCAGLTSHWRENLVDIFLLALLLSFWLF